MKNVVLISCVSKKLTKKAKAQELYTSSLFKRNLQYSQLLNPDGVYILSAKHGLVSLKKVIAPYNETLNDKNSKEVKEWAERVMSQLAGEVDISKTHFIFLAGEKYRKHLLPKLPKYSVPLKGLTIGRQLQRLKALISTLENNNHCKALHDALSRMKTYQFPFNSRELPLNGIYILFQKREAGHGTSRIVRVGTHTGEGQLPSRMRQHFIVENKDRSIFRKNIGRCILNKASDSFLENWEIDLTTTKAKKKYKGKINLEKQNAIEEEVSKYLKRNFCFVVIPMKSKEERLFWESRIISTVSKCIDCKPSSNWLGNHSPKKKIRESGLWLVNELYKKPLSASETKKLFKALNQTLP